MKNALLELDWSQRHYSAMLGVHHNTVGKWIGGEIRIPRYAIHHITTALELKRLQERLFPPPK